MFHVEHYADFLREPSESEASHVVMRRSVADEWVQSPALAGLDTSEAVSRLSRPAGRSASPDSSVQTQLETQAFPNRESTAKNSAIHSSKARHGAYTSEPRHDVHSKSGDLPHESNNRDPADRIGTLRNLFRSSQDHHARPCRGEDPGGRDRCRRQRAHAAVPCERMRAEQVKT